MNDYFEMIDQNSKVTISEELYLDIKNKIETLNDNDFIVNKKIIVNLLSNFKNKKSKKIFLTKYSTLLNTENNGKLFDLLVSDSDFNGINVLTKEYKLFADRFKYRKSKQINKRKPSSVKLESAQLQKILDPKEYALALRISLSNEQPKYNDENLSIILKDIENKFIEDNYNHDTLISFLLSIPLVNIARSKIDHKIFKDLNLNYKVYSTWQFAIELFVKSQNLMKTKDQYRELSSLLVYVSIYVEILKKHKLTNVKSIEKLEDFKGSYFVSSPIKINKKLPKSIMHFIGIFAKLRSTEERSAEYTYEVLIRIKNFFEYVSARRELFNIKGNFNNPILNSDIPKIRKRTSTNKMRLPSEAFWIFYGYSYKMIELINKINDYVYNSKISDKDLKAIFKSKGYFLDTELIEKKLNISLTVDIKGKSYKINKIRKEILSSKLYKTHSGSKELIHPGPVTQVAVALETGLRHQTLQWLSADFDKLIPINANENDLYETFIKVDKSKQSSWYAFISGRVIESLRNVRNFNNLLDYDVFNKPLSYDGHGKGWGSYIPLMNYNTKDGTPYSDTVYRERFRALLVGVDDILKEIGLDFNIFKENIEARNLKTEITPHSTRVMVVSELVNHLPPEYISKYITGHAPQTVAYYTKINNDEINNLKSQQSLFFDNQKGDLSNLKVQDNIEFKEGLISNPIKTLVDFGAMKNLSDKNWETVINSDENIKFSYESTHICPFNGICPKDVVDKNIYHKCHICPYAIRTVDHLPAICAIRRKLLEDIEKIEIELSAKNITNKKLMDLQDKRKTLGEELAAYSIIRQILDNNLHNLKDSDENHYFAFKPKALQDNIVANHFSSLDDNEKYIIDRIQEVNNFPDLESDLIKAKVQMVTAKILASTGDIRELIKGDFLLSDGTAHSYSLIKNITNTKNINKDQLIKMLNVDINNIENDLLKIEEDKDNA